MKSVLPVLDSDSLRSRLKLKNLQSQQLLTAHHPTAIGLLRGAGIEPGKLRQHATKLLASGATAAALMLTPPLSTHAALPSSSQPASALITSLDLRKSLVDRLKEVLPVEVVPLTGDQEANVSRLIHDTYGIHAVAELDGNKLNRSYGLIGAEQHLPRYPGDTVEQHDVYQESGITPGRGAWGYFAYNRADLTDDLITTEKWYVAVPTLYLPDWEVRLPYLRDWYKYRKVAVVNPQNGKLVIAAVADSGPASWTGKHFGGSPEVMHYLERQDGKARGPVILFFVDDPQNQIPLGPLEYNLEKGPPLLAAS